MVTERFGLENIPGTRSLDWEYTGSVFCYIGIHIYIYTIKDWLYENKLKFSKIKI